MGYLTWVNVKSAKWHCEYFREVPVVVGDHEDTSDFDDLDGGCFGRPPGVLSGNWSTAERYIEEY